MESPINRILDHKQLSSGGDGSRGKSIRIVFTPCQVEMDHRERGGESLLLVTVL